MTKSDLINRLSIRFPQLTMLDTDFVVKVILDGMAAALGHGKRIEIRSFGSFLLTHRSSCHGRNPRSGEKVDNPEKHVPHFKPGKEMRKRVNLFGR